VTCECRGFVSMTRLRAGLTKRSHSPIGLGTDGGRPMRAMRKSSALICAIRGGTMTRSSAAVRLHVCDTEVCAGLIQRCEFSFASPDPFASRFPVRMTDGKVRPCDAAPSERCVSPFISGPGSAAPHRFRGGKCGHRAPGALADLVKFREFVCRHRSPRRRSNVPSVISERNSVWQS
jgi:hypothetical protein